MLKALIERASDPDTARRSAAIQAFLEHERRMDETVKFKQVALENNLLDLFTDLPLAQTRIESRRDRLVARALRTVAHDADDGSVDDAGFRFHSSQDDPIYWGRESITAPAADFLLNGISPELVPRLVIEGAPGQGKSTVAQYVCQVHRCRLLKSSELSRIPKHHQEGGVRIPFRVDLRNLAAWLHGRNPFGPDEEITATRRSLETFLAAQIENSSGGAEFSVADLHALSRESSFLLALDGLDEVADIQEREKVVQDASTGIDRLSRLAFSVQVVVTSRPTAFENSPGFAHDKYVYLELAALTAPAVRDYSDKWIAARRLDSKRAGEVRRVIEEKLKAPHMRDLARNPMQLAILLSLVHQRTESLPDKRTALYDSYVGLFFDREAEKTPTVARNRDLLIEIHQYLAWTLHVEAETGNTEGRISDTRLRELLTGYLEREEKDTALVDALFTALVERVVAIVSRIQGTYEFEVQPLREYFAARFLYDTAHHSSPGNERRGDKTDRFDALARNFYWLNVTRFFAGCFSKGEILSLVERLQVLFVEDGFRQTDHPRRLASMLLADWVFAQHPKSMKAVVDLVLQAVATRTDSMRPTDVIELPLGSGQSEVAERCWELWQNQLGSDRSAVVAQTLAANSTPETIDERWLKEALAKSGVMRTNWLARGLWTGSLARATQDTARSLAEENGDGLEDPSRLNILMQAGYATTYENDQALSDFAIDSILNRHATPSTDRSPRGLLEALAQLARLFHRPTDLRRTHTAWGNAVQKPAFQTAPSHLTPVNGVITLTTHWLGQGISAWQTSLEPWTAVTEALRENWGDGPTVFELAVAGAGIRKVEERGSLGEGFFDHTHPLTERARYARLLAGSQGWWSKQLEAASSELDQIFIASLFFAWASRKTLISCLDAFDSWMVETSSENREHVYRIATTAHNWGSQGRTPAQKLKLEQLPNGLSPTTAIVLSHREVSGMSHDAVLGALYRRYFSELSDLDRGTHFFACRGALHLASQDDTLWPEALKTVKAAYSADVATGRYLRYETHRANIPADLASDVVENWEHYPLAIVALAEESCRRAVGRKVKSLHSVAIEQDWEWI